MDVKLLHPMSRIFLDTANTVLTGYSNNLFSLNRSLHLLYASVIT